MNLIVPDPALMPTPPPTPDPGAFTPNSFFTSPSTYLTLVTYLLPVLNLVLGQDVSEAAQALANAAPIIATGILLVARNRQQIARVQANTVLAQIAAPASVPVANTFVGRHVLPGVEERLDALEIEIKMLEKRNDIIIGGLQELINTTKP